jgi:hypothetical protein
LVGHGPLSERPIGASGTRVAGVLAATLGAVLLLGGGGTNGAVWRPNIGPATVSATGTVGTHNGALAKTLGAATASGAGSVAITGRLEAPPVTTSVRLYGVHGGNYNDFVPASAAIPRGSDFTVMAWAKSPTAKGGTYDFGTVWMFGGPYWWNGFILYEDRTHQAGSNEYFDPQACNGTEYDGTVLWPAGTWRHVCLTGTAIEGGTYDGYVGGVHNGPYTAGSDTYGADPIHFGNGDGPFGGNLVAVKIWTRKLSGAEVAAEMGQLRPVSTTDLYLAADFTDLSAGLLDTSGNSHGFTYSYDTTPPSQDTDAPAGLSSATSLGAATLSGVGTVAYTPALGTLSATLGAATVVAGGGTNGQIWRPNLGVATLSATGTVAGATRTGTLTQTLGAATLAATGKDYVAGTLGKTLGAATLSGAGTVRVSGTLGKTLGAATASGTGTVAWPARTGTLSKTLGAATVSGAGTTRVSGVLSKTLGAATLSAAGHAPVSGTLSKTLGSATASGVGHVPVVGTAARTLGALTASATGTVPVHGALSRTLGTATASATGVVGTAGTLSKTLGAATLNGAGTLTWAPRTGTLTRTLGTLTVSATGSLPIVGAATRTLGTLTASGAGAVSVTGALDAALGPAVAASTGKALVNGVISSALGVATLSGTGHSLWGIEGELDLSLDAATATADGTVGWAPRTGVLTQSLAALVIAGHGYVPLLGYSTQGGTPGYSTPDALPIYSAPDTSPGYSTSDALIGYSIPDAPPSGYSRLA